MSNTRSAFWLVWNPQGRSPSRQHETQASARRESERLARENRGQRFIVLRSVSECVVDDVHHIEYVDDNEAPF